LQYRDMADAYPDLFVTADAARMALRRELSLSTKGYA